MEMTYHAAIQRKNRINNIVEKIGMGQVIKEKFIHGCYSCITDTGITIIKSAEKDKIITIYVTTFRELVIIFNGTKNIPPYLRKRVDKNQSLYTKEGKTIWK